MRKIVLFAHQSSRFIAVGEKGEFYVNSMSTWVSLFHLFFLPKSYNAQNSECNLPVRRDCVQYNSTEFFQIVLLIVCQMVTIPQYTINCRQLNYFHVDTKVTLILKTTHPRGTI